LILPWLSCPSSPIKGALFWPPCRSTPVLPVLFLQYCPGSAVLAVLSRKPSLVVVLSVLYCVNHSA
jgi:hypothetical protein